MSGQPNAESVLDRVLSQLIDFQDEGRISGLFFHVEHRVVEVRFHLTPADAAAQIDGSERS